MSSTIAAKNLTWPVHCGKASLLFQSFYGALIASGPAWYSVGSDRRGRTHPSFCPVLVPYPAYQQDGFFGEDNCDPCHHRVHHAVNPEYMDKNLSQIFIVWDKLFGTFVEEIKDVPPVYGITRPARTWNPIRINFQHIWLLIKDAWRTSSWKEKLTLWFKPTGYRPADVAAKYPVYKIEDVYHFKKYDTKTSPALNAWAWVQLLFILISVSYLFGQIAYINSLDSSYIYWYGAFTFLSVYALTELMDRNRYAIISEILRSGIGLWFLWEQGDWFGSGQWVGSVKYMLAAYFVSSILITGFFNVKHYKEDVNPVLIS